MRLREAWESFEREVVPREAGEVQRTEMRRAFYGGAWAVLCAAYGIGDESVSEEQGVEILAGLIRECETFKAIQANRG